MGAVKAEDTNPARFVALKFLPESALLYETGTGRSAFEEPRSSSKGVGP
jgi:hypothetical protein